MDRSFSLSEPLAIMPTNTFAAENGDRIPGVCVRSGTWSASNRAFFSDNGSTRGGGGIIIAIIEA
tara:strand:- start:298 stop:492 length:195 start_codon:yes stop_codon:yes gene_type:complete